MNLKLKDARKVLPGEKLGVTNGNGETLFVMVDKVEPLEMNAKQFFLADGTFEILDGRTLVAVDTDTLMGNLRHRAALAGLVEAV